MSESLSKMIFDTFGRVFNTFCSLRENCRKVAKIDLSYFLPGVLTLFARAGKLLRSVNFFLLTKSLEHSISRESFCCIQMIKIDKGAS